MNILNFLNGITLYLDRISRFQELKSYKHLFLYAQWNHGMNETNGHEIDIQLNEMKHKPRQKYEFAINFESKQTKVFLAVQAYERIEYKIYGRV